ncbi:MAG: hypothetical protein US30_C0006G0030 [Candidatus Moranbacteria bacterium GW2011_GWF2_36_839]|nr:MAG: hypothetical protein US27_C0006G0037 [Candidatus Moranbacteria bacterium GW2011_GWF1_36_78]KKQ17141.1 MAG: hypothetical protein US30_C0006G0030 [Candidatus Moranbacteria bacterium GW2011_GWF2_36_839]HAT74133.1 hypothetical protein [Candidatus Moranbacteria bacterium]HBY10659.1 hypothetical protein [Candidatus Moranbacteria bacterium]
MAKFKEKIKAINLRKEGLSIKEISKILGVSKSSASVWCSDVELSKKQIQKLHERMVMGGYVGRLKGANIQRKLKQERISFYNKQGKKEIEHLQKRELFIAGLALYWGEGGKRDSRARFYNSDHLIIAFIMRWFREILGVSDDRFIMYVTINQSHKERLSDIIEYWSKITKISTEQFRRPILIKSKNKKVYENHSRHYGTLCVSISRSSKLFYQIKGWLIALGESV